MYQPITYSLLVERQACLRQLALFKKHFGKIKPIPLTREVATQFGSLFAITWAAYNLLTKEDLEEYKKARAHAWREYRKARSPAWREYQEVNDTAWANYDKAIVVAFVEIYKRGLI